MKIMTFHLADEEYAVDLGAVSGVSKAGSRTAAGSGELFVLELAARFGVRSVADQAAPVVVLHGESGEVGLRVDRLGEVVELDEAEVRGMPRYFESSLLRGVVAVEERLVVLLDGPQLLREASLAAAAGTSSEGDR